MLQTFPKEKGLQSYVAVPIYSSATGEILGHIAALDDKPMTENQNQTSILKIFAARAGSEIDRLKAEEKLNAALRSANIELQQQLKESEERFRDLFEEAPIAYVHEGLDSKFIRANRAAMRILGIRPDEIEGTYGFFRNHQRPSHHTLHEQIHTDKIQCRHGEPKILLFQMNDC